MLINVKVSIIVGILTCMSRINFALSCIEYEQTFITTGPDFAHNSNKKRVVQAAHPQSVCYSVSGN